MDAVVSLNWLRKGDIGVSDTDSPRPVERECYIRTDPGKRQVVRLDADRYLVIVIAWPSAIVPRGLKIWRVRRGLYGLGAGLAPVICLAGVGSPTIGTIPSPETDAHDSQPQPGS